MACLRNPSARTSSQLNLVLYVLECPIMRTGLPSHLDFSVGDPSSSIPFYDVLLTALGYERHRGSSAEWQGSSPTRAAWGITLEDGSRFGIDLRPATSSPDRAYNRYEPGPHHLAFGAATDAEIDRVYEVMLEAGAKVLDEPRNYGGTSGYGAHYYAVFFSDPDGFKVEVVHAEGFNG